MSPPLILRTAVDSDLQSIARVHREAFPGFFLTRLGLPFLHAYYTSVLHFDGGILLIAELNGRAVGFVGGFVSPQQFYQALAERKWRFFLPICRALVSHPSIWFDVAVKVIKVLRGRREVHLRKHGDCELASLGVSPCAGRAGIGSQLVLLFLEHARNRAASRVYLTTDALQNAAANRFYSKLGFQLAGCWNKPSKRPMNEYIMDLRRAA